MSVSVPVVSNPAEMLIVALPPLRFVVAEVYPPPVKVTEPVGAGLPPPALTETVTDSACAVVMLDEEGATVTVGEALLTVSVTALLALL